MKKILLLLLFVGFAFFYTAKVNAQSYQDGEWLQFRVHYGWFNASYATLEVKEKMIGDTPVHHVLGRGKSTGLLHLFFKVDDDYQSFIHVENELPLQFIRNIDEGGYTKNKLINFNHRTNTAKVRDLKNNTVGDYTISPKAQDMISTFYYVRNRISADLKKPGDSIVVNMFFDESNYKFKTVYLGDEIIRTKFGKVKTLKLRPYVQSGRVFEEKDALTVWVTADENRIPVRIKAKLLVGSLTADLESFKGLKHPFELLRN